jgi:putative peptide zinc metalloprotease protein
VELLKTEGLLVDSVRFVEVTEWDRMKPLPIHVDRLIPALTRFFRPAFGWPGYIITAILGLLGLGVFAGQWPLIWYYISDLLTHVQMAGESSFSSIFSFQSVLQIAFFFTAIPFLREIAKAVACQYYGMRVHEIRYGWFMRFIPRCIAGIHGVARLGKSTQMRVLAAGLWLEFMAFCLGMIGYGIFLPGNPVRDLCTSLAIGAALRFLLTANPLGEMDGSVLFGLWRDEPDLHRRSTRLFRAWLFRDPMPEPLTDERRRNLIIWGGLSDLTVNGLTIAILWLLGYLLIQWMGGLGAVALIVLVFLKYERMIRSWFGSIDAGLTMARAEKSEKKSVWYYVLIVAIVILLLCLIPYPYEVSGEFRMQPVSQREVRSEVSSLIDSIEFSEGSIVKSGDVIARLSTRIMQRDLDVTQAALKEAQEHLKAMEAGARPEEIAQLEQAVKAMETKLKYSEETLVRTTELHDKNHVSEQDYQNVLQVRDLDKENLEIARLALVAAQAGVRKEEIEAQRANVESLEVSVRHMQDDISRCTVRSPIDGRVVTMYIQGRIGQQVVPGDVIAVVEDMSTAVVRIALPEYYSGMIDVGADVRMRPWAYTGKIFKGNVTAIMPVVMDKNQDVMQQATVEQERGMVRNMSMPEDRIVPVLAEINNTEGMFRSEMTGYAKISAGWKPIGYAFLQPIIRFIKVQVWSWIP